MTLDARMKERCAQVERALDRWLPPATAQPRQLHESMRYSVFAGGKRLRPALLLEACAAVGGEDDHALPAACALELIHTYSLVHDDLPCMDDDDLRRGKPTNHKVFGEALALLCGDALLTHAFLLLAREQVAAGVPTAVAAEVAAVLAEAAGSGGMVGGQAVDMDSERKSVGAETVEYIHRHKTAALLRAAVESGALIGGPVWPPTAPNSGWRSRSLTTSSTSRAARKRSANAPGRTSNSTKPPTQRCTG